MKRRILPVLLGASMLLAGCGNSTDITTAAPASSAAAGTEVSSSAAGSAAESSAGSTAAGSAASGDKIHLEYFNVKSEVEDVYKTLIEKFEQENPDIEIEQINDPDPTTVLQTRMSTNNMPDILSHWATDPVFKEMVSNDMLMDLTDQDFMKNVKDGMLETVEYDGKAYCLPISMNAAGIFYNKDVFDKNGLQVPATYEDLIEDCKKLKSAGVTPFAMYNQASHAGQITEMLQVSDIDNFEDAFAKIQDGSAKVSDYSGFKTTAQQIIELNQYAQDDSFGTTYEQAISDFANGSAAMIIGGIWMIPTINEDNASLNYSTFGFPGTNGRKVMIPYQNDHCLAVSASCKHPEAALKFLAFMSRKENAQYYADKDGSPSYIKDVQTSITQSKPLLDYFNSTDNLGIWPDQLWKPGVIDNMNSYADELVQNGDTDSYLANIQTVLSSN